jgi:hypothetical protein
MITILMGIVVVAVAAVVILFLPSKKPAQKEPEIAPVTPTPESSAPKQDDKKEEVKDGIIAQLDKEIAQLKEELQKEQLKNSSLQGELNAAKKAELDLAQEVEELKKKAPSAPSESEAVAMELLKNENETLKGKLLAQTKEIDQLKSKASQVPQETAEPEKQSEPPAEEPAKEPSAEPESKPEEKPVEPETTKEEPKEGSDEPQEKKPESDATQ